MANKKATPRRDKKAQSTGQRIRVAHKFTHDEFMERNRQLAEARDEHDAVEEEMKANAATLKARVKALKAKVNQLINEMRDGAEMRDTEVLAQFDRKVAMKHYFHHAPGEPQHDEYIRSEAMTQDDYQLLVPDEPHNPKESAKGKKAAEPEAKVGEEKPTDQEPPTDGTVVE